MDLHNGHIKTGNIMCVQKSITIQNIALPNVNRTYKGCWYLCSKMERMIK